MAIWSSPERLALAQELNGARIEHHMSVRAAARAAGVPAATVQGWLSGRYFPTPALRGEFTRLANVLGLEDRLTPSLWNGDDDEARTMGPSRPPYMGLAPYEVADAELFFGRDGETTRLASAVQLARESSSPIVTVVGGSGSGKTSLLAAGLVGRECSETGALWGLIPRFLSVDGLPEAVTHAPSDPEIWILDQVEESLDPPGLRSLASLAAVPANVVVLMAVRSDALARLAEVPALAEATGRPFVIAPMTTRDVRDVITRPCERIGTTVEEALSELILRYLGMSSSELSTLPPGTLPFLSNALRVAWTHRASDTEMMAADYLTNVGLPGSVNALAESVYAEVPETHVNLAQATFLTLVSINDSGVRRRVVDPADLTASQRALLQPFIQSRLVAITDVSEIQISHDAVVTNWSRLGGWVDEDRDRLRAVDHVRHAAQAWSENARPDDLLLPINIVPGLELATGAGNVSPLTALEREFLSSSRRHFASQLNVEQSRNRSLRAQRATLSVVLAVAVALAVTASYLYAHTRSVEMAADARQVAGEAESLRAKDPNLRAQMALMASRLSDTVESRSALLDASALDVPTRWLGVGPAVVAASRDGQVVVRGDGEGGLTVWRQSGLTGSPGTRVMVGPHGTPVNGVAVERVGDRYLAAVAGDDVTALWDVTDVPALIRSVDTSSVAQATAISADGRMVAFGGASDTTVWYLGSGSGSAITVGTVAAPTQALAFAGRTLYMADGNSVASWTLNAGTFLPGRHLVDTGVARTARVQALALSPDGKTLAAAYNSPRVTTWSLGDGRTLGTFTVGTDAVNGLAYAQDGDTLAVASSDQHTYLLSVADGSVQRDLADPSKLLGVAWSGSTVVTSGTDGAMRVWQEKSPVLSRGGPPIRTFAGDSGGRRWLAGAASGRLSLWHVEGRALVRMPSPQVRDGLTTSTAVAVSPDGTLLCVGTRTGAVLTWELTARGAENPREDQLFESGVVRSIAFDATGHLLAAVSAQGRAVEIVKKSAGGAWVHASTVVADAAVSVAFAPDRAVMTVALAQDQVEVWDTSDPARPLRTATIDTDSSPSAQVAGPGGLLVLGTDAGTVSVWNLAKGQVPTLVQEHRDALSAINGLTLAPDSRTVAAASADGMVWVWTLHDGRVLFELDGSLDSVHGVSFVSDGAVLVAGGENGVVRSWTFDSGSVTADLCARLGDPLTPAESARYLPEVPRSPACGR